MKDAKLGTSHQNCNLPKHLAVFLKNFSSVGVFFFFFFTLQIKFLPIDHMRMAIRMYESRDFEPLYEIWMASFQQAHGDFLGTDFVNKCKNDMRNIYIPLTAKSTWVFEDGSEPSITGFIAMIDNEIGGLFIKQSHQGKGIGTKLVKHVEQFHLQTGLEVEVFQKNTRGRAFYAKYGFRPMKEYLHEESGQVMLRLKVSCGNDSKFKSSG